MVRKRKGHLEGTGALGPGRDMGRGSGAAVHAHATLATAHQPTRLLAVVTNRRNRVRVVLDRHMVPLHFAGSPSPQLVQWRMLGLDQLGAPLSPVICLNQAR